MQQLLYNFKVKQGKIRNFLSHVIHSDISIFISSTFSWTSKNLAAAIGVPINVLNRRITFWTSKVCSVNSS